MKPNTKKAPLVLTPDVIQTAIARIEAGEQMLKVAVELGCSPNGQQLRAALRATLGEDGYAKLISKHRKLPPGFAGSRAPRPLPSDAGLPLIPSTSKSAGWSWRHVNEHAAIPRGVDLGTRGTLRVMDTGARILVLRAPDGVEYTQAFADEPAHLLRAHPLGEEYPPVRLVRWEESRRRRLVEKGERADAKLEAHVEAQREAKRRPEPTPTPVAEPRTAKRAAKPAPAVPLSKKAGWKPSGPAAKKAVAKKAAAKRKGGK